MAEKSKKIKKEKKPNLHLRKTVRREYKPKIENYTEFIQGENKKYN